MPQTTDSGAKKILGTDNWRGIFDVHNDTVDAYDGQIAGLQDGLAIIANGNVHSAIPAGYAVYVKNHGSLATGLYKARAAIGANVTLSTSNLAADSTGWLNDLQGQVDSLNSNSVKVVETTISKSFKAGESGYLTVDVSNLQIPANPTVISIFPYITSIGTAEGLQLTGVFLSSTAAYVMYYSPQEVGQINITIRMSYI